MPNLQKIKGAAFNGLKTRWTKNGVSKLDLAGLASHVENLYFDTDAPDRIRLKVAYQHLKELAQREPHKERQVYNILKLLSKCEQKRLLMKKFDALEEKQDNTLVLIKAYSKLTQNMEALDAALSNLIGGKYLAKTTHKKIWQLTDVRHCVEAIQETCQEAGDLVKDKTFSDENMIELMNILRVLHPITMRRAVDTRAYVPKAKDRYPIGNYVQTPGSAGARAWDDCDDIIELNPNTQTEPTSSMQFSR